MKYLQGFERLMAGLMMAVVILLAGNLYLTLDKRQTHFETKLTASVDTASNKLNTTLNSKFEELRGDVLKELQPVSNSAKGTLDATTKLLSTANGQMGAVDIKGVNSAVANLSTQLTRTGDALSTTAENVGDVSKPLARTLGQIDTALPDFIDCAVDENGIGNPTCVYRRYADMTADADKLMNAVARATPQIVESVKKAADAGADTAGNVKAITADARKVADKYVAPPTLLERIEGIGELILQTVIVFFAKGGKI